MAADERINVIISAQAEDLRRALRASRDDVGLLDRAIRGVKDRVSTDFDMRTASAEVKIKTLDETVKRASREIERDKEFGLDTGVAEAKLAVLRREASRTKNEMARAQLSSGPLGGLLGVLGSGSGGSGGVVSSGAGGAGGLAGAGGAAGPAAIAGSAPILAAGVGTLGALTGSAAAGALGAGAIGVGGLAAGALGAGALFAVIKPMVTQLQAVEKAQTNYTKAVDKYGASSKQAATAQKALNAAVKEAGGKDSLKALDKLKDIGDIFQKNTGPARASIAAIFSSATGAGKDIAPAFAGVANQAAKGLHSALAPVFAELRGREFKDILATLGDLIRQLGKPVGRGLADVISIVGNIAKASAPFVLQFARGIASFLDRLRRGTSDTLGLRAGIGGLVNQFKAWLGLAGAVGRVLITVFSAGAGGGKGLVTTLTQIVNGWNKWLNTKAGQEALKKFFSDSINLVKALVAALAPLVAAVVKLVIQLMPIFTTAIKALTPLIKLLVSVLGTWLSIVVAVIGKIIQFDATVIKAVESIVGALKGPFTTAFKFVEGVVSDVVGFIAKQWGRVPGILEGIAGAVQGAFHFVFDPIEGIVEGVINTVIDVINAVLDVVGGKHIGHVGGSSRPSTGVAHDSGTHAGAPGRRATGGMLVDHPMFVVGEEAPTHPEVVIATNPAYRQRNVGLWMEAGQRLGVPGFASGGVLGGALDTLGGLASGLTSGGAGPGLQAGQTAADFIGKLPHNPGGPIVGPVIGYVLAAAKKWITDKIPKVDLSIGGGGYGKSTTGGPGVNPHLAAFDAAMMALGIPATEAPWLPGGVHPVHSHYGPADHYSGGATDFPVVGAAAIRLIRLAQAWAQAGKLSFWGPGIIWHGGGGIDLGPPGDHTDHVHISAHARGGWLGAIGRAAGGPLTVTGPVSTFGPPLEGAGSTAYGGSSSQAGIALNPHGGGNWNDALARSLHGRWFDVGVGGHHAHLPVIDKGPSAWGKHGPRKIDITGAGARRMGIDPYHFPTDAIGKAIEIGARGSLDPTADLVVKYDQRTGAKVTHSKKYWDHMRRLHPVAYSHYKPTPPKKKKVKTPGVAAPVSSSWVDQHVNLPEGFYNPFDYAFNKAQSDGDAFGMISALDGRIGADQGMIDQDEGALALFRGVQANKYRFGNTRQDKGYIDGAVTTLLGALSALYSDLFSSRGTKQGLQDGLKAFTTADTSAQAAQAEADAQARADLLSQQLELVSRSLAVSEGQGNVFRQFGPLLGGRLVGSFAQGGKVMMDGLAYVHQDETIQPAPKGPYGNQITQANQTAGKPTQVHVYIDGEPGALTKRVRAEIDGYAAPVVSQQIGQRRRLIAGVRG